MKALVYVEPNVVEVREVETPSVSAGEALVKVRVSGICGSDVGIAAGKHPRAQGPLVLGHESAGDIAALGEGTGDSALRVADRVTINPLISCGACWACRHGQEHVCRVLRLIGIDQDGTFAEYVTAPVEMVCKLPEGMSHEAGALVEPLAVGVHAARSAELSGGEVAVVVGAGPIGLVTAMSAREAGAGRIFVTDVNPFRLGLAREFGFEALEAGTCDVVEVVREATEGEGADVVFEAAGSAGAAVAMTELVRARGRVVVVSVHKAPHEVNLRAVNFKEITLVGARVYSRADFAEAIALAGRMPVDKLVTHRLALEDGVKALSLAREGGETCKVLVTCAD